MLYQKTVLSQNLGKERSAVLDGAKLLNILISISAFQKQITQNSGGLIKKHY